MNCLTDEELVAKCQEAGQVAGAQFAEELFQRHYSRVALWCFRFSGDRQAATDLAQDVFVKAWAHLEHFRGDSKFSTWLYLIARNHCFNASKRERRDPAMGFDPSDLEALATQDATFDRAFEQREMAELANSIVASTLTPTETQVMTLHYVEDLPLPAISRLLGLENASGAKAYVVSAKRKLKLAVERWRARARSGESGQRPGREASE